MEIYCLITQYLTAIVSKQLTNGLNRKKVHPGFQIFDARYMLSRYEVDNKMGQSMSSEEPAVTQLIQYCCESLHLPMKELSIKGFMSQALCRQTEKNTKNLSFL